jgi:hypothetical protein
MKETGNNQPADTSGGSLRERVRSLRLENAQETNGNSLAWVPR